MPSKGIQVYTYIGLDDCEVIYNVPKVDPLVLRDRGFANNHLEIDKRKQLGIMESSGRFSFTVKYHGNEITNQWCEINPMTGNPSDGTMQKLADQKAIIRDDVIVCYGFYDAGSGSVGLPSAHQVHVTVTRNFSRWMGEVAPNDTPQSERKLTQFVLPAAHDIGMNSMEVPDSLLRTAGSAFVDTLQGMDKQFANIANVISGPLVRALAPNIIQSLAVTQKDTVHDILSTGARYFEFRPARLAPNIASALPNEFYFMHGPIPGMLYTAFLRDVVDWLKNNGSEIVVIQLRWDGVANECVRPNDDEQRDLVNDACRDSGINPGNFDDMRDLTVRQLRDQGKRLIITRDLNVNSTYDDAPYATLNGESIVPRFEGLSEDGQNSHHMTNIQCQATATNIQDVVVHSVTRSDQSNSCLLATKAICDHRLLPWVRDHALEKLTASEGLIVVMADFFEGATADTAIELSRRRLG